MKRALFVIAALAISLLLAAPVSARTQVFVVDDDLANCPSADFNTIQAAVAAAMPGDKILVCAGTYHHEVAITKNDLTITAKDAPDSVVLDGDGDHAGFELDSVTGVTIEGFLVRHAHEADILLRTSNENTIRGNRTTMAGHDGIELVNSARNLIEHNVSFDNAAVNACGIQITGAGSVDNLVRHNVVMNNEWGIQIDRAAGRTIVFHNEARGNRGNGIRNIRGASNTVIEDNRAFDNGLTPGALTDGTNAGIRIGSGTGITVARNHAFGNLAVDLRAEVTTATFENNHCDTSLLQPDLCAHDEGEGH